MRRTQGPAAFEEQAELRALREQADATGRELSDTAAALAARIASQASPRARVRRRVAVPSTRAAAAAACGLLVIVAAAVLWQHRQRT